ANILFEDNTTWGNNDFDDFVVQARIQDDGGGRREPDPGRDLPIEDVPEPATFAGLALVVGGIFLSGSCKKQN
ncbi:MAG: PEP-CTERM sorting domain-containing protein, partial [Trichodesmium sp. St19_bin1]|nr:PEP-CTERM sorting domain-containing protein [Trichodesmium sp. St19_bin1]